jgi:Arylsulfotransferase (ASST)
MSRSHRIRLRVFAGLGALGATAAAATGLAAAPAVAARRHVPVGMRAGARTATGHAAPAAPTISPLPGTPDANPDTQISILGPAPRTIQSVSVIGSVSGAHRGRLESYRGVIGASFVLDHPLTQGEHVRVTVRIRGRNATRQSFTVARLGGVQPVLNANKLQPSKLQHFVSEPSLLPPVITIRKHAKLDGDIFLTPLPSPIIHPESNNELTIDPVGPGGPMIIAPNGRLVWFDQLAPPDVATNFRIQRYLGHRVLTWWQGGVTPSAFGLGEGVIADGSYGTVRTVKTGNGYEADLHEFLLTGDGEALLTVYSPVLVHLPGTKPGSLSPLLDSLVQEVDIRTGLVVWEWHGLGHIPVSDSYASTSTSASYDVYHLNSIQMLAHGQLLVSARDTSAIYDIDRATGRIVWTLGGKASTFRLGRGARFYFQHDAQLLPGDRVSLFDDEGGPPRKAKSSRGLILALNVRHHTATVVRQFFRTGADTPTDSEGSLQNLAGGNKFVGFGSEPFFSEFSPTGKLLFDARLPIDDGSYREYLFPWQATPHTRPAIAARRASFSRVSIFASWNGATTVARWQLLAGANRSSLKPIGSTPDRGFETKVTVASHAKTFAVRALSSTGRTLATSPAVPAP